jgi:outer membrane protein OmpA-like peptidoglycan-associated protein
VKKLWSTANGSAVRLGNFDIGRYQLKPEHKNYLLLEVLPVLLAGGSIRLIGLASRSGSFDRNKDLSRSRVDEVVTSLRNYLGSGPRVATGFSFGEAAAA